MVGTKISSRESHFTVTEKHHDVGMFDSSSQPMKVRVLLVVSRVKETWKAEQRTEDQMLVRARNCIQRCS
jgi:hypothetical protein